ncbi:hypothetical protein JCM10207_000701 [Rhodosporidiobolus poonsookiae]
MRANGDEKHPPWLSWLSVLSPQRIFRFFFPAFPGGLGATVQGDVILGLHKRTEAFLFLSIRDVDSFKRALKSHVIAEVTTTAGVVMAQEEIDYHRLRNPEGWLKHLTGVNLAFSAMGLAKMGVDVETTFPDDFAFRSGQEADAYEHLGDRRDCDGGLARWKEAFQASNRRALDHEVNKVLKHLGHSVSLVRRRDGQVRPGDQAGHEHFGFADGIAQPTIIGFNDRGRLPGESAAPSSVFVVKDGGTKERKWLEEGSFMVFRELEQRVPELEQFCKDAASEEPFGEITPEAIAARTVGRWKNGVPLALAPRQPYGNLIINARLRQNFTYAGDIAQESCPYAAHIRKANPRVGSPPTEHAPTEHLILRRGIPYGPEVSEHERDHHKTQFERGLLFVCYQSKIEDGFQHIQKNWLNNPAFPADNAAKISEVGQDLIAGQNPQQDGGMRTAQGILPGAPDVPTNTLIAPPFVIPRGGEYFFMPSIPRLKYLSTLHA